MNRLPLIILCTLVAVLVLSRVLPHPPNFTPLIAVAFFAGVFLKEGRLALLVPLVVMLIADWFVGFHGTMLFVYGALAVAVLLGRWLEQRRSLLRDVAGLTAGSVVFFVISNVGVWLTSGMYPLDGAGLVACFVAAIPFFHNTLASTLLYGALILVVERFGWQSFGSRGALKDRARSALPQ